MRVFVIHWNLSSVAIEWNGFIQSNLQADSLFCYFQSIKNRIDHSNRSIQLNHNKNWNTMMKFNRKIHHQQHEHQHPRWIIWNFTRNGKDEWFIACVDSFLLQRNLPIDATGRYCMSRTNPEYTRKEYIHAFWKAKKKRNTKKKLVLIVDWLLNEK